MLYRFGEFTFDPDRGLARAGEAVALEPRAGDLLLYLLENPGRIVTRDELCERIWDGRIVSDAAISTQIRAVRRALDDDRDRQRFIRTHPRRGFSFVAEVACEGAGATPGAAAPAASPLSGTQGAESRRRWPAFRLGTVAAAFLILVAAVGLWRELFGPGPADPRDLSIVVMPFENLSADADRAYIADAFTEDLVTDLSRIRDAFVISRSTSFTYRGKEIDPRQVAADLGVRYVLEGSLQIEGEGVRINARLIDAAVNRPLWSDRYERPLADLFDVQDNVTGKIASVLRAELRRAESARQDPELTRDAWDHALRGNVILYNHETVSDYQEAHAHLSRAVELDPGISSAWGGLSFVHFVASFSKIPGISAPDSPERSLDAALKATEADPMNAEPWWLVGAGYARTGRPELGMPACATAIDLNPNMDCGHVCAGLVHLASGEPEKAIPYFQHALALNPLFRPFTKEKYLAVAYIQTGRNDLAIAALNRALAKVPRDGFANLAMSAALALDGQVDAAEGVLARHVERHGGQAPTLAGLRKALGWLGPEVARMIDGLERAGLAEG